VDRTRAQDNGQPAVFAREQIADLPAAIFDELLLLLGGRELFFDFAR
jgi:hypothetical protein